jgi:hypothetical protein
MFVNAFIGRTAKPEDSDLAAALATGKALVLWNALLADLEGDLGIDVREWHSYSPKAGWALRLIRNKRTIAYLSPARGYFLASFALGAEAVEAARKSGLPGPVLKIIDEAKKYAEGTAVRIEVKTAAEIEAVKTLASVKLKN